MTLNLSLRTGRALILLSLLSASSPSAVQASWSPPPVQATWSYNIGGSEALNAGVTPTGRVISLDLYAVTTATMTRLRRAGKYLICYYSAGTAETFRTDAASQRLLTPDLLLGEVQRGPDDTWPGERWLDLRGFTTTASGRAAIIRSVMEARLDLARQKGCHAVEPDNVDAWANVVNQRARPGTPAHAVSAADQLAYARWTAAASHARGLAVLLKNNLGQVAALHALYDGAINEDCFDFAGDCEALAPFRDTQKAVYVVAYHPADFATAARQRLAATLYLNVILTDPDATRTEPYRRFGRW
ncbi:hypothetical protein GO986_01470 [Deinococcus sp. HMF7620]|uniref:Glycoside-hydrolase family GH114 TIM-barrel domain-containing protein n=1 Tax=Deinococcus arboris TaxID=2682977 RepID=A0A7C9HPF2_9DEIO|nr:endo alpha-1,4 polygalactosaminidase [Deinococcus arboris]MVN85434.1 hypothetical protein [Deinococcus arboris]